MDNKVSPADEAILRHLRQQVDRLQDERYRRDARPSIANELREAMWELKDFTSKLRKEGKNI
tara:strand:- start:230 stop:415 length:186 start_codon:yes stop_codon:yes gene_type:complete